MDQTTTIEQLKQQVQDFCETRDWDQFHGAKDLAIGISTEAAELLEIFRFKSDAEIEDWLKSGSDTRNLQDEMSDVFFFLLRLSQKYGLDLSEAFQQKLKKNAEKYPIEKSKGSNRKYTEL